MSDKSNEASVPKNQSSSHFDRAPTCNRQTDTQTHVHRATANTALTSERREYYAYICFILTQRFRCHRRYSMSVLELTRQRLAVWLVTSRVNCRHSSASSANSLLPSSLNNTAIKQLGSLLIKFHQNNQKVIYF